MRLTKLHLQNFRIHKDSLMSFGTSPFIAFLGRNFAGKSSIGQALSMCLTPSTMGLDAQGRGFISKIKRGAAKAVITAELQTKRHLIQRTVTLNTNAVGRKPQTVCLSDPSFKTNRFDEEIERQRAVLTVVLNTEAFLTRMDEKEQKNLLAGLALPSRYDFPPEIIAQVEAVLGPDAINFAGEPFTAINQAYRKLFDERQIVNRQVKEFVVPMPLPVPNVDSLSLQNRMVEMRQKRAAEQQRRDQAVADANKVEQSRIRAKAKVDEAINSVHRRESAIRDKLLKDGQLAYLCKVAAGREELDRLESERRGIITMRDSYVVQLKSLEKLPWNSTTCPTCEQSVDPDRLKTLAANQKELLRQVNVSLGVVDQKIKALGDVDDAIALIEAHEKALRELDSFGSQEEERQREIEKAQKDIPPPTLFDFAPYNESLSECDQEIERLSGLLRPAIVAEERGKEIEIKRGQLAVLKEKAGLLDQLVKYFDKDGIKAKLIGQYIGAFEQKLNQVMGAWGYSCALSIEPYSFDVTNARGDVIPVRELSGAERVMFSAAFQCAVAMTAGVGMVVIDEVSTFLPEIRPALGDRLYEMIRQGYLEQVILLVADASEGPDLLPEGTLLFIVDEGSVRPRNRKETENERRYEHQYIA